MKQPDNHIDDKLNKILLNFVVDHIDLFGMDSESKEIFEEDLETVKRQLDQYYADFYRNKMLEARKDELDKAIKWIGANSLDDYYARIDDITAQSQSTKQER